ncbi:hypothetical protein C8Q74DRAFT_1374094 [Fomes fomentarius]|nr:hypothetical protein C8Q74DRAFT_1374094 [Fomes fomentarius]
MENDTSTLLSAVDPPTADHEWVVQSNTSAVKPNVDDAERTTPLDPVPLSCEESPNTEKESVSKLDALRKECGEKLEQIGRIKDHLEDVKAKGLGESHDSAVLRRADLLKKAPPIPSLLPFENWCPPSETL